MPSRARLAWNVTWPKLSAAAVVVLLWQLVVWTHWRPESDLPGPARAVGSLGHDVANGVLVRAVGITLERAAIGYGIALAVGTAIGILFARVRGLRAAIGAMISGLQTMPSVAWFPFAILIFGLHETAILFVVVLGAGPAIATGLLSGIDHVPPLLLRAGRVLGARGLKAYRHVIIPAALPSFIAGMKQGWAFAWRSLMAGELLVAIGGHRSLGVLLNSASKSHDAPHLVAAMMVTLLIGIVVDSLLFGVLEQRVRRRWGLVEASS
ncbi:MAG: ABC transporter permease [Actinomycetota bacterium]